MALGEDLNVRPLLLLLYVIGSTISAWITGLVMRRRMRRALGRRVSDRELVSINTWMRVKEAEKHFDESKPITPK
jgi:hypothetical protein